MKGKIRIYLDTSVISAYFDERNPERKFLTELFFKKIEMFDAYISEVVLAEIDDTRDVQLRAKLREKVISLTDEYVKHEATPSDYPEDALYIAISTMNEIDYLLSWNFEHIVRVKTRRIVNLNIAKNLVIRTWVNRS